jgi:hypothetical protein
MQFVDENLSTWDDAYLAVTEMENPSNLLNDSLSTEVYSSDEDDEENAQTHVMLQDDNEMDPLIFFRNNLESEGKGIFHYEDRPLLTVGGSPRQRTTDVPDPFKLVHDERLLKKPLSSPGRNVRGFPLSVKSSTVVVNTVNSVDSSNGKKPPVPARPALPKPSTARSTSVPQTSTARSLKPGKEYQEQGSKFVEKQRAISTKLSCQETQQNPQGTKRVVNKREKRLTATIEKPKKPVVKSPIPQSADLLDFISSSVLLLYQQFSLDITVICSLLQDYASEIMNSHKESSSSICTNIAQKIQDCLCLLSSPSLSASKSTSVELSSPQKSLCNVIRMLEAVPNHRSTDEIVLILTWISRYLDFESSSSFHLQGEEEAKSDMKEKHKEKNLLSFHHFEKHWKSMINETKSCVSAINVVHNDRSVNKELLHKDQYHHVLDHLRQLYNVVPMQEKKNCVPSQYFVDRVLWDSFGKSESINDSVLTIPSDLFSESCINASSVPDEKLQVSGVSFSPTASVSSSRSFAKFPVSAVVNSYTNDHQPSFMALPSRPPTAGPIRSLGKDSRKESFSLESKRNSISRCHSSQKMEYEDSLTSDGLRKKVLVRQHYGLMFFQRVSSQLAKKKEFLHITKRDVIYEREHHFIKEGMIYSPSQVHPKEYLTHLQNQQKHNLIKEEETETLQSLNEKNRSNPSYAFLTNAPNLSSEQGRLFLIGLFSDVIRSFLVRNAISGFIFLFFHLILYHAFHFSSKFPC